MELRRFSGFLPPQQGGSRFRIPGKDLPHPSRARTGLIGRLLLLVLALSVLACPAVRAQSMVYGDLNGDGRVDIRDALLSLRIAIHLQAPTPLQQQLGDVAPNPGVGGRLIGDGRLNVADSLLILRAAVGLISSLGPIGSPGGVFDGPITSSQFVLPVTGPLTHDIMVPGGYRLSGHVRDALGHPLIGSANLLVYDANGKQDASVIIASDGSYQVILLPGTYFFAVDYLMASDPSGLGGTTYLHQQMRDSVGLSGTTTHDFTLPTPSTAYKLTGSVVSLDPHIQPPFVVMFKQSSASGATASATAPTFDGTTFSASLPAGHYDVEIALPAPFGPDGALATSTAQVAAVDMNQDQSVALVLPTFSKLSGLFGGPNVHFVSGTLNAAGAASTDPGSSGTATEFGGTYSIHLPDGGYSIWAGATDSQATDAAEYRLQLPPIAVHGNTRLDVSYPPLPSKVTVSGRILGPDGKPLTHASLSFSSAALAGEPPNLSYISNPMVGSVGDYQVSLPVASYTISVQVITLPGSMGGKQPPPPPPPMGGGLPGSGGGPPAPGPPIGF